MRPMIDRARPRASGLFVACALLVAFGAAGCGDDATVADPTGQRFPDVVAATVESTADGTVTVSATISSPYDTPERYADAWRVLAPDGTVLAIRKLTHDHANEQPFTRSLDGVEIPAGTDTVTIEARDLANGWGGATVDVVLPG